MYRYLGIRGLSVAVYFAVLITVAKLLGKKTMVRSVHDYRLHLDTRDRGLSRTLFLFGKREIDHYRMLQAILRPEMKILDIGANIGYYAIMEALVVGPSGNIVAIEPMLPNIEMLRRNIDLNNIENIEVVHGAVSAQTGTGQMFMSTHSNLHTFHNQGTAASSLDSTPVDVPTFTLQDVAAGRMQPDLMRMDVEGHEVEILGQLADLVERGVMSPMVIFETHLSRYTADNDFVPVLKKLFAAGYGVTRAASSGDAGTRKIAALGYKGSAPFYSDFGRRVIFDDIGDDDAIDAICRTGGLRTILVERTG